jgi:prepilin-type N-terminal cleavage/methylation domain-containing protein
MKSFPPTSVPAAAAFKLRARNPRNLKVAATALGVRPVAGFTMIEIAISLAIIGIGLVAIIGVLPRGMDVQRENRQITIINQDANVFLQAITSGARGLDDLTNYVYAITNYQTLYNPNPNSTVPVGYSQSSGYLNTGQRIIGLLSTPEYTSYSSGAGINDIYSQSYYSNHVVAYVRSLSGPAVEKPPQDNAILLGDSFSYRIFCVNAPVATDTNAANLNAAFTRQQAVNLHELRLTFLWPILPSGQLPSQPSRQTFRTLVAGQIAQTNDLFLGQWLYFYQSQSFTNAP